MARKNRNSIAQRLHARRTRRNPRARRAPAGVKAQHVTMLLPDGATVVGGAGASVEDQIRYLDAHALLPPCYPWPAEDVEGHLQEALAMLADPVSDDDDVLVAIMMLAHIGDPRALRALSRHAASTRVHADMARLAEDECAMWLTSATPTPRRGRAAGNNLGLN